MPRIRIDDLQQSPEELKHAARGLYGGTFAIRIDDGLTDYDLYASRSFTFDSGTGYTHDGIEQMPARAYR